MSAQTYRYAVLGCGRQGAAAAYDLACRGGAGTIRLIDADRRAAEKVADWLRVHLPAPPQLELQTGDASDATALTSALAGIDVTISALPYRFNLLALDAAAAAGSHFCDMGGQTEILLQQLTRAARFRERSLAAIPDCGQAPGMATTLMVLALESVDRATEMEVWDGGLPLDPQPPLGYQLLFSVEGLTNEYDGPARNIRAGRVVELPSLSERQWVEFPAPFGRLEAFCASGTASTFPDTFVDRLPRFTSRILRYPGHLDTILALKALGFFAQEAVIVDGKPIVPRRLTEQLLARALDPGDRPIEDAVLVRIHVTGTKDGRAVRAEVDCQARFDPMLGLTAMQRCTGFDAAIVAALLAERAVAPGVHKRECAIEPARYVAELARRGINVATAVVPLVAPPGQPPAP